MNSYFEKPDTPAPNSPVGALMLRVMRKNPGMNLEEARVQANQLLERAASRRKYTSPRVLSSEEQARERIRLKSAFESSKTARRAA